MHERQMILSLANLTDNVAAFNVTKILHIFSQQIERVGKQPGHHHKDTQHRNLRT